MRWRDRSRRSGVPRSGGSLRTMASGEPAESSRRALARRSEAGDTGRRRRGARPGYGHLAGRRREQSGLPDRRQLGATRHGPSPPVGRGQQLALEARDRKPDK